MYLKIEKMGILQETTPLNIEIHIKVSFFVLQICFRLLKNIKNLSSDLRKTDLNGKSWKISQNSVGGFENMLGPIFLVLFATA
jgi:hypothetical protein